MLHKIRSFNHSVKLSLLTALLLTGLPAHAATDYVFSSVGANARFPAGCSGSNGNYICTGTVNIAAGDTITIEHISSPTTITFNLFVLAGDGFKINEGGSATDLTLKFKDALQMGSAFIINANLEGNSSIVMEADSVIHGSISTSPEGVVTTGKNTTVYGDISTRTGVISIAANSHIHGNISSNNIAPGDGAITVAANSVVDGSVTSKTGAISIAFGTKVFGSVKSTEVGAIDMKASVTVTGEVSTLTGVIGMGADCTVGSIATKLTGDVGFGANVRVNGSISTATGGIGGGADSIICGSMTSSLAGGVGTGARTLVGGDIAANVGPITTGATNTIGGKGGVSTQEGPITIGASNVLGGQVTAVVGTITLGEALQRGVTVPPIAGCPSTGGDTNICENGVTKQIKKVDFKNNIESSHYYLGTCAVVACTDSANTLPANCTPAKPVAPASLPNEPTPVTTCPAGDPSKNSINNTTVKHANVMNATTKDGTIDLINKSVIKYGEKEAEVGTMDLSAAVIDKGRATGVTLTGVTLNNVYINPAVNSFIQVTGGTTTSGTFTSGMITEGTDSVKSSAVRGSIKSGDYITYPTPNASDVTTQGRQTRGTLTNATITNANTTTVNGVTVVDGGTITDFETIKDALTFGTVTNATFTNATISNANSCFTSGTVGLHGQLNWKEGIKR
ncbi:MAG: hypothetical protein WCJ11_10430 [Methylococcaceae bacterium]